MSTQYDFAGKVLRSHLQHNFGTGGSSQTYNLGTKYNYDGLGRIQSVGKATNTTGTWVFTYAMEYDDLGQLSRKRLAPDAGSSTVQLEKLDYDYNVRGWMLGANRDYVKSTSSTTNYFGFDLGYDKTSIGTLGTYAAAQLNGNINGTVWKSTGDDQIRKYDFEYDASNRLMEANFTQYTNGFNLSSGINYTVENLQYDLNGNISSMKQFGWKLGSGNTNVIDNLTYNYESSSNRLKNVIDGNNEAATKLGDFRTSSLHPSAGSKSSSTTDYVYDDNGNLIKDYNKDIATGSGDAITYNHLNLPATVVIRTTGGAQKGTITYTYDASGNKLKKTVVDNTGTNPVTTTTYYVAGAVYEQKTTSPAASGDYGPRLQFLSHEEGRIRKDTASNTYNYDYFVKDHLGNIRMVLTSELDTAFYPAATMETASSSVEEAFYSNLNTRADKPAGYPSDPYVSGTNDKVARLRGDGSKIGPAIALKVMAGDKFNVHVSSYYKLNGSSPQSPNAITDLASVISGSFGGIVGGKYTSSEISGASSFTSGISSFLSSQSTPSLKPKAYLNWILFDEQFNYVSGHVDEVGNDDALKSHDFANQAITKNGYLYIYVSNETPNVYVYFDNLQLTHIKGPILEETHYYPFGVTMHGISSKAVGKTENKFKFQEQEFAVREFADGSGLETYEFKWRMHDPQTGRFWQIDPLSEKYVYNSVYAFSENKVTGHRELEGLESWSVNSTTLKDGTPALTATVTDISAPFSVTQDGVTTGFFPNAEMNRQLGGAVVSDGRLLIPNAKGDYLVYTSEVGGTSQGSLGFSYTTTDLTPTPTTTTDVVTPTDPVILNGEREAWKDPVASTPTSTYTTGPINSATPPTVNIMYSDQGIYPNTFTVRDNSSGANLVTGTGDGGQTVPATDFRSGGTFSVVVSNRVGQPGDGYNFTLAVTPTVSTPTTVPTPAALADQYRVSPTGKALKYNSSMY